jgi:predicted RND superfamily exporter protein
MQSPLSTLYHKIVLQQPVLTLIAISAVIALFAMYAPDFKLDASADSLILEHDKDLRYYRSLRARYGSDEYLIISYRPENDLFSDETLSHLRKLRDRLSQIERVESVVSILDVPLISSPPVTLAEISKGVNTLEDPATDTSLARAELLTSPLYKNLIVSPDGRTTALLVNFKRDEIYFAILKKRNDLREKELTTVLTREEEDELIRVSRAFKQYSADYVDQEQEDIAAIRAIMDEYREGTRLFLGGIPMISSDMIDFIRHDLSVFGLGIFFFLIIILVIIFHHLRWVLLSLLCCFASILFMFGFLGLVQWRVTVVSSNFTSLLLILTLSLTVHLIVRYRELHAERPAANEDYLVFETMKSKAHPSFYTALTTIVAFGSLMFSGIRPVIDFGWMMAIGICAAFLISYVLFPALLMLFKPELVMPQHDFTAALTRAFSNIVERHSTLIKVGYIALALFSVIGITHLTVENRFIDNFKETTEIYQGMEVIDRELGGTTPLDIVLDAPAVFFVSLETEEEVFEDEEFYDASDDEVGLAGTSYWYDEFEMETLQAIHDYLDRLPQTGKVLSLATTMNMMKELNKDKPLDNILLSIIEKNLTDDFRESLFKPYMSEDGNQVRFSVRVLESDPSLQRNELLKKIRSYLVTDIGLKDDQIHLSGMIVLYNNMLQSLYRSQILTIGFVFLAIMVMFVIHFRSIKLALIAITPNMISAGMVLGLMGWLNIPLDIMTITIAAITIGIAVDNTIHYIHRFQIEVPKDKDYVAAMKRCHASVGRAMYYTSITVIIGFSILALSSFMPTIYFGLLTGMAMTVALIANLTLLPTLLIALKPD